MNGNQQALYDLLQRILSWATGAMLALCLWIASNALDKLTDLDARVQTHETRITVLEVQ